MCDMESSSFTAGDVVIACEPWVWSFQYNFYSSMCAQCFKDSETLQTCANCKLYRFCNKECQTANWKKDHRHECEMLKKIHSNVMPRKSRFEHECSMVECAGFGCLAGEILIAKIINKIQRRDKDDLGDGKEKMSAMKILDLLPYDPAYDKTFKLSGRDIRNLTWPADAVANIPNFYQLVKKVYYNALPIYEQWGKMYLCGVALFPQALHREMTPVCSDVNVTMNLQKRMLVLHATEDIPQYTGLKNLRHNELLGGDFLQPVRVRRNTFREIYSSDCSCRHCTDEYDAEINPLKCVTSGCMERIPSDARAAEPCPQCGAINSDRLNKFKKLIGKTEDIATAYPDIMRCPTQLGNQLLVTGDADVLHSDAHFRFPLGYGRVHFLKTAERYEEAWDIYSWMVPLVRNVHPKYHLARAYWLLQGGEVAQRWYPILSEQLAVRTKFFSSVVPKAVEWLEEAQQIYEKLSGPGSRWEQEAKGTLDSVRQLRGGDERSVHPLVHRGKK